MVEPEEMALSYTAMYNRARATLSYQLKEAIQYRADQHKNDQESHGISCGSQVWMYLDLMIEVYARRVAHMWLVHFG